MVVGVGAELEGEVLGETIEVLGRLTGQVVCDAVHVRPGGELSAHMAYRLVSVAPGAAFEGVAVSSLVRSDAPSPPTPKRPSPRKPARREPATV